MAAAKCIMHWPQVEKEIETLSPISQTGSWRLREVERPAQGHTAPICNPLKFLQLSSKPLVLDAPPWHSLPVISADLGLGVVHTRMVLSEIFPVYWVRSP